MKSSLDYDVQLNHLTAQLIAKGNLEVITVGFSEYYLAHIGEKTYKGFGFIKRYVKELHTAIPEIKVVKLEILSKANDIITWKRTLSGTHKAPMKGIPSSNKKIKWHEMVVSRFEKDKIIEEWIASDLAFQMMLT